ncbi:MAG: PD-(D/E)XK nuclease family protein, partial [Gemmatimonadota bacterium]
DPAMSTGRSTGVPARGARSRSAFRAGATGPILSGEMSSPDFGPHPDFTWSRSRAGTLAACARRYYYHYYGSWRGWEDDADAEAQRAYLLKKLTSLSAELGRSVHRRAFEIGFRAAQGLEPPSLEELLQRTRNELNRVVLSSRDRRSFEERPGQHDFLRSSWYGDGPGDERIERARRRLEKSHRRLSGHDVWGPLGAGDLEAEYLSDPDVVPEPRVEVDGVPVYGEPDLVLRRGDGRAVVVDWKSGRERREDVWQVALHGLWLESATGEGECLGRVEYLAEDVSHEIEIGRPELDEARERVRESLDGMRQLVDDPDRNAPRPKEGFPLTDDRRRCRWCDFFELCEDELRQTGGVPEPPGGR